MVRRCTRWAKFNKY